jgi:uncharacterized protein YndB with AHSA1/START domain
MTIRKSIWVGRTPETSFGLFCEDISEWWPGGFGGTDSKLFLERKVGGRFYERRGDSTEYEIGRVTAYRPPSLVAFTWRAPSWDVTTRVRFASPLIAAERESSWSIADGSRTRRPPTLARTTTLVGTRSSATIRRRWCGQRDGKEATHEALRSAAVAASA